MNEFRWTQRLGHILVRTISDLEADQTNPRAVGAINSLGTFAEGLLDVVRQGGREENEPETAMGVIVGFEDYLNRNELEVEKSDVPDDMELGQGLRLGVQCARKLVSDLQLGETIDIEQVERTFRDLLGGSLRTTALEKEVADDATNAEAFGFTRTQN